MEWIRQNPKSAVAVGVIAVLCVVILGWGVTGGSDSARSETLGGPGLATPTATPDRSLAVLPTPSPSTAVLGPRAAGGAGGAMNLPGLPGGSLFKNLPRHRLHLHVTSEGPIGTVGWFIPTSLRKLSGIDKNVGHVWDLETIVYGNPDYARVWLQAGGRGYPITCTITVDGAVTEQRATDGPYAKRMCQG
jgi:hypothetical protein